MIIDQKSSKILKEKFNKEIKRKVEIYFFTSRDREIPFEELASHVHNHKEDICHFCDFMRKFLEELREISSNKIDVKEFEISSEEAKKFKIERIPTILIDAVNDFKIKYIGAPIGEEAWAFIDTIIQISKDESNLSVKTRKELKKIDKSINIKVFVTPQCPYCPYQVLLTNNFAIENKNIEVECIDAIENYELADKYEVSAVPYTVINDKIVLIGVQNEERMIEALIKGLG